MKTHEDEQYVVIKAYKFTVFGIWRDFNVLSYIACLHCPYIRVYRLYDTTQAPPPHHTQFLPTHHTQAPTLHQTQTHPTNSGYILWVNSLQEKPDTKRSEETVVSWTRACFKAGMEACSGLTIVSLPLFVSIFIGGEDFSSKITSLLLKWISVAARPSAREVKDVGTCLHLI